MKVYSQLERAQLENKASDYSGGTAKGLAWINTSTNLAKIDDGTSVRTLVTTDNTQTLTNKTISTASNTIQSGAATDGQVLTADGAGGVAWETPDAVLDSADFLLNLSLAASVGSSALTIAVKDKAGSDPSAGSPVRVGFRNATSATGTYTQVSITSALSMTVSSGSTLGHASGVAQYIYVYLINNAGAAELAVSSIIFDEGSVVSTTAEGGAGAADSIRTMYSTSARSNVPCRLVGRILSTQATAGTWASSPTEIAVGKFHNQVIHANYTTNTAQSMGSGTPTPVDFEDKVADTHNAVTVGGGWVFTAPESRVYHISAAVGLTGSAAWAVGETTTLMLYVNGSSVRHLDTDDAHESSTLALTMSGATTYYVPAGQTIQIAVDQGSGSSINTDGNANKCWVSITAIPGKI